MTLIDFLYTYTSPFQTILVFTKAEQMHPIYKGEACDIPSDIANREVCHIASGGTYNIFIYVI